jgi:glucuronate isomerase
MTTGNLARELEEALAELPTFDAHTHLVGGRLGARGLHDILLYHMVVSDLYAAGCPSGARLTQYPGWPGDEEAHARLEEAVPLVPRIANTSCWWMVRSIMADLYGWTGPITPDNWRRLDAAIRERADDRAWHHGLWDRLHIRRTCTEWARRGEGADDRRLQYSLEWGMFARAQWGEWDTAVYELERCWGRPPEPPSQIGGARPAVGRAVRTLDDVHAAIDHYVGNIPYGRVISTATGISTQINYQVVSEGAMAAALSRRAQAGPLERDLYACYVHEAILAALEQRGDEIVFQFSLGAEPLPFETGSILRQQTLLELGEMIARHPRLRFQCFLGSRAANQALCTLCRELPNLSLAGYWWHNFFPASIRQVMAERLEMLPAGKQVGFFSDAYCVEWVYGKARLVRKQLARVLAERIEQGFSTREDALATARAILYQTPQSLLGMAPFEE